MLNFECLQELERKRNPALPLCNGLPANKRLTVFVTLQLCFNAKQGGGAEH